MAIDRKRVLRSAEKLAARNRYKQAIGEYSKVLEKTPNDARILLKVADLYTRMNAYSRAVDIYARVGRIYADDGFAAKAVAVYKQVQQLIDERVPHLADFYLFVYPTLANLYQELRLSGEALGMYDAYASMMVRCGRLREAATILEVVVERGGDNPLTRLRLAELLIEEGEEDKAVAQFLAAADSLVLVSQRDEAVRVLDHALVRVHAPVLPRRAAQILLARGRPGDGMQALVRLQQAFRAEPKNLETLALLARAFELIGQKDRAFEVRKETVRIAKDLGAMDTARALVDQLVADAPTDPTVQALVKTIAPPPTEPVEPEPIEPKENIPEISSELLAAEVDGLEPSPQRHAAAVHADLPVVEEAGAPSSADMASEIESTKARARVFVERGELSRAVHTLELGLKRAPQALSLSSMLKDVLLQSNNSEKAAKQLLSIAAHHVTAGEKTQAIVALREALTIVPGHAEAKAILDTFQPGGAKIDEPPPVPSDVLAQVQQHAPAPAVLPPVPSDVLRYDGLIARKPLANIRGFRGTGDVDDALEEAEFFASRGLQEDALAILREQLDKNPGHLSLLARLDQLGVPTGSAAPQSRQSVLGLLSPTEQASRVSQRADSELLDSALADFEPVESIAGTVDLEGASLDVDDLFASFKEGIAEQIGEDDSEMHYDLAVAYFEMGQLDSAIDAFRKAARAPARECVSLSMIASVYKQQGKLELALEALEQAAGLDRKTREEEVGVHYQLGDLFEARKNTKRAVEHFDQVVHLAPDFRDARARLKKIRGDLSPATATSAGDDEFDRAFDSLTSEADDD